MIRRKLLIHKFSLIAILDHLFRREDYGLRDSNMLKTSVVNLRNSWAVRGKVYLIVNYDELMPIKIDGVDIARLTV